MESTQDSGDRWDELKSNYAQSLASGVDLPRWAAKSFSSVELAVLGAIRDAAYKAPNGACSLTVAEIAGLAREGITTVRHRTLVLAERYVHFRWIAEVVAEKFELCCSRSRQRQDDVVLRCEGPLQRLRRQDRQISGDR